MTILQDLTAQILATQAHRATRTGVIGVHVLNNKIEVLVVQLDGSDLPEDFVGLLDMDEPMQSDFAKRLADAIDYLSGN